MNYHTWKIRTKLALMVAAFIAVLGLYAELSYNTRQQLQINGPYFDRITRTNELLTDIEVGPLNLGETFLTAQRLVASTDANQRQALIGKLRELRQSYDSAFVKSEGSLGESPNPTLKNAYLVRAHEPAVRFFGEIESKFIPAVVAGDRVKATAILVGPLQRLYIQQMNGIEEATPLAAKQKTEMQNEAEALIKSRGEIQVLLLLGSLTLFALVLGPLIGRSVVRPLKLTLDALASTSSQLASTIDEHEQTALSQAAAVNQTTSAMDELEASFIQTAEVVRAAAEGVQRSSSIAKVGAQGEGREHSGGPDCKP
jgi:methyl-accepting chemotaxis protein